MKKSFEMKTCIIDKKAEWFRPTGNRLGKPEVHFFKERSCIRSVSPANRGKAEQVELDHLDVVVAGGGDDLLDGGLPALPAAATN